ncbi:MAG TPA: hypothetical protein VFK38_04575, partial [Candidatus Limnocylindrales bacterium]|nr:hypothetical protein [Candidatus Limnocylindrales bacterium]
MKSRYVRSFASADEVMELELLRSSVITIGGLTVSYDIHQPGWRWSTHVKPIVRTESCQSRHLGMLIRGTIHAVFDDGTEAHAGPLDLIDWPAGHDAWVVGDEPVEMIGWTGGKTWLAPVTTLGDRVLATLLFSDIVDSTGMALTMGDQAWSDVLAQHQLRTREIVQRYRGRVVDFAGDGVLAMFDG